MRTIDKWVGVPLTFILTLLIKSVDLIQKKVKPHPRNLLFIELSEMGSTILANPAMVKAQKATNCELFFVIFSKNKASLTLLKTIPDANIFTLREHNLLYLVGDTIRFLFWTRKKHIDTVIDLELFSRFTALLAGASGAANRVGFYSFFNEGLYRGDMLTHKVSYNPHIHIAKNFIALVNALIADTEECPYSKSIVTDEEITLPKVRSTPDEIKAIYALIAERYSNFEPDNQKIILVNPNASELLPQRRWMRERYCELIERILDNGKDTVVLITGAPGEKDEAEEMREQIGNERCINFAGATPLGQLIALYNASFLMVTNDSGPGHFSSITPLATFVLFGPETPALYGSLGNSTPIFAGLACSPCVSAANHRKTACTDNKCLQAITVDQVFSLVQKKLTEF